MGRRISVAAVVAAVVVLVSPAVEAVSEQQQQKGQQQGNQQDCQAQRLCRECIQTVGCAWCVNPLSGENCQQAATVNMSSFCSQEDLQNPQNRVEVVVDKSLTDPKTSNTNNEDNNREEEIIQLKPQRIKLRLRKDTPQTLNIKYRRADDYPVDLYYLMDLSKSMEDDKNNLANMGKALADTMRNLTKKFTLGFGSFVDKVMMPFTNTTQLRAGPPCNDCALPYSFRNDMKLSASHAEFQSRVTAAKISGNLDHPEGGFDALMQAMVCTEQIGWRDVARRILVFSTDAKFHHAGDGRLAGVVEPNDEQCHLSDGEYKAYHKYDYPSIGQINKVAKEKNINIIFAVLDYKELYEKLSAQIDTSSIGMLEAGSSNVLQLIKNQYNDISNSVTLTDNSTSDISIKYRSSCKGNNVDNTDTCDGIQEMDEVTFNLEITAKMCPGNGERSIVEVKTLEDSVILDIEFLCSCDCSSSVSPGISKCKNGGSQVCGVCECATGYYGEECECDQDSDSGISDEADRQKCMLSKTDTKPCSGRGTCKCGVCYCNRPDEITGPHCQCNSRKCMGPKGKECSGHGHCNCNDCKCDDGYSGSHCQCEDKACKAEGSTKVCSDHGTCDCGRCNCDQQGNMTYIGQYCEDCLSCGSGKCNKFKDCIQCLHFGIGPLKNDCNKCDRKIYQLVKNLDDHIVEEQSRQCTLQDEQDCYLNFTYRYLENSGKDEVFVQETRKCPEAAPILDIVFSLIGVIVGIGVLSLFLWKVFTTIHDRREYAKFLKESEGAQFGSDQNPLYVSATTTTQNPMFDAQQQAN